MRAAIIEAEVREEVMTEMEEQMREMEARHAKMLLREVERNDMKMDAKIEMLEKEKEDLLERLKSLKNQTIPFNTPSRLANKSGVSPYRRYSLSIKSPKTPGGPLRDVSNVLIIRLFLELTRWFI